MTYNTEATGAAVTAASEGIFPVALPSGLAVVAHVNAAGDVEVLHETPICPRAASAMTAELRACPSPSGDFEAIAAAHELRARIWDEIKGVPDAEEIAEHLAFARPWERCHREPHKPGEHPF